MIGQVGTERMHDSLYSEWKNASNTLGYQKFIFVLTISQNVQLIRFETRML